MKKYKHTYKIKLQRNKKGKAIRFIETDTTSFDEIEKLAFYHYSMELFKNGKGIKVKKCKFNSETVGKIEILSIERVKK